MLAVDLFLSFFVCRFMKFSERNDCHWGWTFFQSLAGQTIKGFQIRTKFYRLYGTISAMNRTLIPLIIFAIIPFLTIGCSSVPQSSAISGNPPKQLLLHDHVYEPYIKTVLLHPDFGVRDNTLPAVIPVGQWNLLLEFDDLEGGQDSYYARFIHCNSDWSKSQLLDLDFLNEFNEFPINELEYSTDTHIPYVHYRFRVPPVKLPGNYVLAVYRGSNQEDVVLTRRFMVYDNRVAFTREGGLLGPGHLAELNQQINFSINYRDVNIPNPMQDVTVSIRQNQRWDNMATALKPSFIRAAQNELEYRFFDPEKMFKGGTEFRFFDMRALNATGRNVERIDRSNKPYDAYLFPDKSRAHEVYSQINDLNGNFIINTLDFNDPLAANYVFVNFTLISPQPVAGNVYVTGAFNYWQLNDLNRMQYNTVTGAYHSRQLLKQGWYDYIYHVQSDKVPPYFFEGSHFETENEYEIFFYYRPFQPRADLLIGYIRLEENAR